VFRLQEAELLIASNQLSAVRDECAHALASGSTSLLGAALQDVALLGSLRQPLNEFATPTIFSYIDKSDEVENAVHDMFEFVDEPIDPVASYLTGPGLALSEGVPKPWCVAFKPKGHAGNTIEMTTREVSLSVTNREGEAVGRSSVTKSASGIMTITFDVPDTSVTEVQLRLYCRRALVHSWVAPLVRAVACLQALYLHSKIQYAIASVVFALLPTAAY
jgi:hypothetical protein